jgi:hypothetical protein
MVFRVSDSRVAVARNFVVSLGDWSSNLMGVQIAASLSVNHADDIAVANELERRFCIKLRLVSVRVEEPVVVGVFVVVAGDLLLLGAFWVGLNVRME